MDIFREFAPHILIASFSVFFVAFVTALAGRSRYRLVRILLPVGIALVLTMNPLAFSYAMLDDFSDRWSFYCDLASTAVNIGILARGLRPGPVLGKNAASTWSPLRLGLAAIAAPIVTYGIVSLTVQIQTYRATPNRDVYQPNSQYGDISLSHYLVGIESLTAAILLLAWLASIAARRRKAWHYLPLMFAIGTASAAGLVSFWMLLLLTVGGIPHPWTPYCTAWTFAFIGIAAIALYCGLRRPHMGTPAAANWPAGTLALSAAAALLLMGVTLSVLDNSIKTQMAAGAADSQIHLLRIVSPEIPDRDNAAILYDQASHDLELARVQDPKDTSFNYPLYLSKENQTTWRNIDPDLVDNRDPRLLNFVQRRVVTLDLLRLASHKSACHFYHDYGRGYTVLLPEINTFFEGSAVLLVDSLIAARTEDWDRAEANLAAMLRMSRHMNEPIAVTQSSAIFMHSRAAAWMEKLLALEANRKGALQGDDFKELLGDPLQDSHFIVQMRRAYRGEKAMAISQFTTIVRLREQGQFLRRVSETPDPRQKLCPPWLLKSLVYRLYFLTGDLASYRIQMDQLENQQAHPYWMTKEYMRDWDQLTTGKKTDNFLLNPVGIIATMALPRDLTLQFRRATEADALQRLMRTAYSATRYRAKHGKFPDKLEDLVPEFMGHVPLDPFDGKPLRMKKSEKGRLLYSVGANLEDDGGVDGIDGQGDLSFRLP